MNIELFILDGHGQYVWPAFIFSFVVCFLLYKKTKKELHNQEKIFYKEFKEKRNIKIEVGQKEKKVREIFSSNSI